MGELEIGQGLVGRKVCNPARPEWGAGTVLCVQSATVHGQPQHRVSVQFATGHRTLLVPPAHLVEPRPEAQRAAGWLAAAGGDTLDDRLRRLPDSVAHFLGMPVQRFALLVTLYAYTEDPSSLGKWARDQTHVADPLSLWSRDELAVAFRQFCGERDAELRVTAARLKQAEGQGALDAAVAAVPEALAAAVRGALQRPI